MMNYWQSLPSIIPVIIKDNGDEVTETVEVRYKSSLGRCHNCCRFGHTTKFTNACLKVRLEDTLRMPSLASHIAVRREEGSVPIDNQSMEHQ